MTAYINTQNGKIIEWDEKDGVLIKSVWKKVDDWMESTFEKNDEKEEVEETEVEENRDSETTEEASKETEEEEVEFPVYPSVKALKAEADTSSAAKTKAGAVYEYDGSNWVKKQ